MRKHGVALWAVLGLGMAISGITSFDMTSRAFAAEDHVSMERLVTYTWDMAQGETSTYDYGSLRFRVTALPEDQWSEDWDGLEFTILQKGQEPIVHRLPMGFFAYGSVGVYPLDSNGTDSIVVQNYSGGAHCCAAIEAIAMDNLAEAVEIGWYNGDGYAPEDVDGDGRYEFWVSDERFLYTFDAYAFSFPPVQFLGLENGAVVDRTREAGFREMVQFNFEDALARCYGVSALGEVPFSLDAGINSGCASALALSTILGNYDEMLAEITDVRKSRPASDYDYPELTIYVEGEENPHAFTDVLSAVQFALTEWGYLE